MSYFKINHSFFLSGTCLLPSMTKSSSNLARQWAFEQLQFEPAQKKIQAARKGGCLLLFFLTVGLMEITQKLRPGLQGTCTRDLDCVCRVTLLWPSLAQYGVTGPGLLLPTAGDTLGKWCLCSACGSGVAQTGGNLAVRIQGGTE